MCTCRRRGLLTKFLLKYPPIAMGEEVFYDYKKSGNTIRTCLEHTPGFQELLAFAFAYGGSFYAGELYAQRLDSGGCGVRLAAICHFLFGGWRQCGLFFWYGGEWSLRCWCPFYRC